MGKPVVWFEIGCRDSQKTQAFYRDMFDWGIEPFGPVGMVKTGTDQGIPGHICSLGHEPHNYVTFYVEVDDVEAMLARAEDLGGRRMMPPTEVPGMGTFAWFTDPEGTIIGLWRRAVKT